MPSPRRVWPDEPTGVEEFMQALGQDPDEWWGLTDLQRRSLFIEAAMRYMSLAQVVDMYGRQSSLPTAERLSAIVAARDEAVARG